MSGRCRFIFKCRKDHCRKSKGKRNSELGSVQLSQMEKDRILSEQESLHESLEKEAERACQGEFAAQARLSEAQAEIDRREWERGQADVALF